MTLTFCLLHPSFATFYCLKWGSFWVTGEKRISHRISNTKSFSILVPISEVFKTVTILWRTKITLIQFLPVRRANYLFRFAYVMDSLLWTTWQKAINRKFIFLYFWFEVFNPDAVPARTLRSISKTVVWKKQFVSTTVKNNKWFRLLRTLNPVHQKEWFTIGSECTRNAHDGLYRYQIQIQCKQRVLQLSTTTHTNVRRKFFPNLANY